MSFQLTPEQDQELFPLCEETELGHVLRNRRMKIVRQRALELFYPKLPPFYKKNFVTFMRTLKEVRGGSLLSGDMYVGGSSASLQQFAKNDWHHELARRCPPIELAPEADFQSSLFPTLSPLTEGGSMPVSDLFNAIYVDILFPYDVPVQEKKARTGTRSDEKEQEEENAKQEEETEEEKKRREEEAAAWNKEIPIRKMEDAPTSEESKTWVVNTSSNSVVKKRFARVFLPPASKTSPKDTASLFLKDWHPDFLASLEAAGMANRQKQQQQQQQLPPGFQQQQQEPAYQPQVTAWILDVIFRGYDEQNFIQIQPQFSENVSKNLSFSFNKPIAIRHCVINKVALLSTGHLLLLDSIRHKVYGRISLEALFTTGTATNEEKSPSTVAAATASSSNEEQNKQQQQSETPPSNSTPVTPEEPSQQQSTTTTAPPSTLAAANNNNNTNQSFTSVGPIPFTAESSSSLVLSAANFNQQQQNQNQNPQQVLMNNLSMGGFSSTSFSTSISGSFAPVATTGSEQQQQSPHAPSSSSAPSSPEHPKTFEQQIQHFFETTGISFVGNSPNEPHRFMSLGLVVFKSMVKTYEHACDADCPLSWNDVLYPELYSQAS